MFLFFGESLKLPNHGFVWPTGRVSVGGCVLTEKYDVGHWWTWLVCFYLCSTHVEWWWVKLPKSRQHVSFCNTFGWGSIPSTSQTWLARNPPVNGRFNENIMEFKGRMVFQRLTLPGVAFVFPGSAFRCGSHPQLAAVLVIKRGSWNVPLLQVMFLLKTFIYRGFPMEFGPKIARRCLCKSRFHRCTVQIGSHLLFPFLGCIGASCV